MRENREASNSSKTSYSILVILVILELLALYILYLVNENFILSPKSCVVVGYELDDSNGVLVCLS